MSSFLVKIMADKSYKKSLTIPWIKPDFPDLQHDLSAVFVRRIIWKTRSSDYMENTKTPNCVFHTNTRTYERIKLLTKLNVIW